jgi:hypothetical protein
MLSNFLSIVRDLETSRMRRLKPASGLRKPVKEEEELSSKNCAIYEKCGKIWHSQKGHR